MSVYMDSRIPVNEIILLRNNDISQAGLSLFIDNDKYVIKHVGSLCNNQYAKIILHGI